MQKGKKGSRVRHATKTEWGVGQLLEDANSQSFHVFFGSVEFRVGYRA